VPKFLNGLKIKWSTLYHFEPKFSSGSDNPKDCHFL